MNKLKTGKGALKDYHRCLADEYDDYAEEPQESDPITRITQSNTYQKEIALQKPKTQKVAIKKTTHWPKYQPDFNFVVASGRIFEGILGEKFAKYLKVSDVVKLLRTCQYLNKIFSKTSFWIYYLTKSYGHMDIPTSTLSSIDIIQYSKYLRFARDCHAPFGVCEDVGMSNDGIVFDTVVIEKDMKNEEEKYLARNIVDSVTVKSQKTIDTVNKLALNGVLTGDMKISWMKDANQVCVWMAGYQVQYKSLRILTDVFFKKKYDEEIQLIQKVYFLNDRYFVIEIEEKNEDGEFLKTFEVFLMEPEDDWFEKVNVSLCKQVLKQTFTEETTNIQVKNIGNSLVFIVEKEENILCVQVVDMNGNDENTYKSKDLHLDADLHDVITSKCATQQEGSFNLYLVDKESNVYLLNYNIESGVIIKRIDKEGTVKEEERLFSDEENQRFSDVEKRYSYGTFKAVDQESQNISTEYLMVYKEKQFYFTKLNTNELIHCALPEYNTTDSKFYNWTICGNYLYLLFHASIQIYQLDYVNYSAILYKEETTYAKFKGSNARWIFVNPCMTVIMSAGSFDEGFVRSVQLWIGSTQNLLMKVNPFLDTMLGKEKAESFNKTWSFDECRLDKFFAEIEDLPSFEKETIECKFEDERLLIQTNFRSYFRDFNVGEKRVNKDQYGWDFQAIYNLDNTSALNLPSGGVKHHSAKKNHIGFVTNLLAHENKNSNGKMKKNENQNWKNVEKKVDTEEKLEKKESRKKGDKYYKNIRQGKHRQKMSD